MLWEKKAGFRRLLGLIKEHYLLAILATFSLAVSTYLIASSLLAVVLLSIPCIVVGPVLGGLLGGLFEKSLSHSKDKPYTGPEKLSAQKDVTKFIASFLSLEDRDKLASLSTGVLNLTKDARDIRILKKFLTCVAHGEQDKAEGLLKCRNPSKWLLMKSQFTDYSDRTFDCTAYQYAYFVKDTHMCRMLEKYMDPPTKNSILKLIYDEQSNQEIELTYQQQGVTYHATHLSLNPLIEALQKYVNSCNEYQRTRNRGAMDTAAWMAVGKAQREVAAHVAQEYCRKDRGFLPGPFNEPRLPRVLTFFNWTTCTEASWFPLDTPDSGLGSNCTVYRAVNGRGVAAGSQMLGWVHSDLAAISCLDKVRTTELTQLRERLNQPAILLDSTLKILR